MDPKIVKKPEMILVGIIGTAPDVSKLKIETLWERFDKNKDAIRHKIEGKYYEIHIQEETEPTMHFCLAGASVAKIENLPTEFFAKIIPAGTYAVFTHTIKDGWFDKAFKSAYDWLKNSEYAPAYHFDIQCFDSRFKSPNDPESIFEIHIPIKSKREKS